MAEDVDVLFGIEVVDGVLTGTPIDGKPDPVNELLADEMTEVVLIPDGAGKDFDPNQPRDPHTGEWIDTPGGTVGATPFTGAEASYGAAAARWDDPEWKPAFDGFEEELGEMGFTRQIGVYQGSFEPSYSVHVDGPDGLTKVRAMDSLQTQEAVSAFIYDPDGDDVEVTIADVGNPDQFFADLSKLGIEGGSFANGGFSTWVSDPEQAEALQDLATEREIGFSAHAGRIDW